MKKKSNENENKKLIKEKDNENGREKEIPSKYNSNKLKENKDQSLLTNVFLGIFVVLSVILCLTLFFYYRVNSNYEAEILMMKDIHRLKANIVPYNLDTKFKITKKVEGYLEITESFDGINIIGKVKGLSPGSTHGVHVLEYSDLPSLDHSKITNEFLKHFNPTNSPHSLPSMKEADEENFHIGDFGNIIANHEGSAFLSLTRKVPIKCLNGRLVVILNSSDKSNPNQEFDTVSEIIGYGILYAVKPTVLPHNNYSNEYLIREINQANKKEFDNLNYVDFKLEKPLIPVEEVKFSRSLMEKKIPDLKNKSISNFDLKNNHSLSKSSENSNRDNLILPHKKNKSWLSNLFSKIDESGNLKNDNPNEIIETKNNLKHKLPIDFVKKNELTKIIKPKSDKMGDSNLLIENIDNLPQNDDIILKDFRNLNTQENKYKSNFNNDSSFSEKLSSNSIEQSPSIKDLPLITVKPSLKNNLASNDNRFIDPYSGLHYSNNKNIGNHLVNKETFEPIEKEVKIKKEKNPFKYLNLNNPVSTLDRNNVNNSEENKILSSTNHSKKHHKKKSGEEFDNTMKKLLDDLMMQENKVKNINEDTKNMDGFQSIKSHKESPLVSLAQISQNEDTYDTTSTTKPDPIRSDFSFMSRNFEPMVHDLMNKTTSADIFSKVDMNLINPYKDMDIISHSKNNSDDKKKLVKKSHNKYLNKNLFEEIKDFKIPSEFYDNMDIAKNFNTKSQDKNEATKFHDMNVLNNLDNIQQIVKNETLHDLSEIKDPIVEIPGFHPHPYHHKKQKNLRIPNFLELNGDKSFEALKNSFGFNFKQKNHNNSIFDKLEEKLKNKSNKKDFSNSNRINERLRTSNQSNNIRSESVNKMLENFSNQDAYMNKMKSHHDKNKLFLNNLKDNIEKLDSYTKNHFIH